MVNIEKKELLELVEKFKFEKKHNLFHEKLNNFFLIFFFVIMNIGYVVSFILPFLSEVWIPNRKWLSIPAGFSAGSVWLIKNVKFKERRDNHYAKYNAANAYIDRAKFQLSTPPTDKEICDLSRDWNDQVAILGNEMKKISDMGF